jgi:hypothetical protein
MTRVVFVLLAGLLLYLWWRPPRTWKSGRKSILASTGVGLLALAYLGWPLDLIPDFTPVGFLDDLIVLITAALWIHQQWRERPGSTGPKAPPPPVEEGDGAWNPHRVLGIERGASREQIAHAYREQVKRYHPDRVSGLGPELQALAHRKTLEIQRAYRELTAG